MLPPLDQQQSEGKNKRGHSAGEEASSPMNESEGEINIKRVNPDDPTTESKLEKSKTSKDDE